MTKALCLKCSNYKLESTAYEDGIVRHPSMAWGCTLKYTPSDGIDDRGNEVADWCKDYNQRGKEGLCR